MAAASEPVRTPVRSSDTAVLRPRGRARGHGGKAFHSGYARAAGNCRHPVQNSSKVSVDGSRSRFFFPRMRAPPLVIGYFFIIARFGRQVKLYLCGRRTFDARPAGRYNKGGEYGPARRKDTIDYRLLDPVKDRTAYTEAAGLLRAGEVVGMPTETVYGLAANALDGKAVAKIFAAKGRPQDNPLIVHIADQKQMYDLARTVPESAEKLASRFWPGPLTMILPKADCIPDEVSAGLDTVGIRLPSHPVAQELIREAGVPLAAPSANTSGRPSTTTSSHVMEDLGGKIPAILEGGPCTVGVESTVVSLAGDKPRLLRPGWHFTRTAP